MKIEIDTKNLPDRVQSLWRKDRKFALASWLDDVLYNHAINHAPGKYKDGWVMLRNSTVDRVGDGTPQDTAEALREIRDLLYSEALKAAITK